jgi:hypothetical protein
VFCVLGLWDAMAFMRKKGECYYMVENHRVEGKVRQQILACLGRTTDIADAIATNESSLRFWREHASRSWDERQKRWPRKWFEQHRRVRHKLRNEILRRLRYECDYGTREARMACREELRAFDAEANSRVDAFLMAEHEKDVRKCERWITSRELNLAHLWKLVPEADRAAVEARVRQKVAEHEEHDAAFIAALTRTVVPEMLRQRTNPGTTV